MDKLYAERDREALGQHYWNHLNGMTIEHLHNKGDIAAEFAHRDQVIEKMRTALEKIVEHKRQQYSDRLIPDDAGTTVHIAREGLAD